MEKGTSSEPELIGLVLAGGESRRMGRDKAHLPWTGEQLLIEKAHDTLHSFCKDVYISCRSDQVQSFNKFSCLEDLRPGIGPIGGIFTAMSYQLAPWLILAVDLPMIERSVLSTLVEKRERAADVTLFEEAEGRFQPLCAIYEPSVQKVITEQVDSKQYAMMALLKRIRCRVIRWVGDPKVFSNINTFQNWRSLRPAEE